MEDREQDNSEQIIEPEPDAVDLVHAQDADEIDAGRHTDDLDDDAVDDITGQDEPQGNSAAVAADVIAETREAESAGEPVSAPTPAPDPADLVRDIEAILFIAPDPVSLEVLAETTDAEGENLAHAVEAVREKFSDPDGGIVFAEIAGGYTFRTGDYARAAVERFCRRPVDYSLSPAAMETLAIVAYLQPITRPEIARIRGVGADTVVANLLDKGLVAEAGRAQQTGAVKYRTTESFEKLFGIAELADLPSLEGFEATPADVEELREKLHLAADKRQ